ncbi:MAG: hypothetical protein SP1CHLAM54_10550 [Chlamydiia bacterium]|nr:hypothetical protein [Chlamydiia bacterium]MCH9615960.1 hypothetical protein [Chlamydiia bacterium]MCH9628637.1 hypothetical protein [Chlamydiia bacterium]
MHFRRDYSVRFKVQKIAKELAGETDNVRLLSWVHGCNGGIFANLHRTGNALHPKGTLAKHNVTTFSGELGIGAMGINRFALSGCALEDASLSIYYTGFKFDLERDKAKFVSNVRYLEKSVKEVEALHHGRAYSYVQNIGDFRNLLPDLNKSFARLLSADPDYMATHKEHVADLLHRLQTNFTAYKQTKGYRRAMPKSAEFPDGEWHDNYNKAWLDRLQRELDGLHAIVRSKITPTKEEDLKLKDVGLIFASTTFAGRPVTVLDSEKPIFHSLKLGDGISHVFATDQLEKVQALVGPKVTVLPMKVLEDYIPREKAIAVYASRVAGKMGLDWSA